MDHDHDGHPPLLEGKETPPPGVRAMAIVRWLILAGVALAAVFSASTSAALFKPDGGAASPSALYACPMHPQITSDRPGECPICHMSLELVERAHPPPAPSSTATPAPRAIPAPASPSPAPSATAAPAPPPGDEAPPDTAPITLSLDRVQAIGVRTALVEKSRSTEALRVTATVEVPERGRAEVHVRAAGTVEAIHVRDTGEKVKAGQVLASVYSPEIFQAEQELLAMGAWASPAPGSGPALPAPPTAAARRKLELLGVGKETIDRVVATGKPVRAVDLSSPIEGYVTRKDVVLGSYAMPDKALFEIADLRRVYIVASLYPHQIAGVRPGDEAVFATPSVPGRTFAAKVDLVYPEVDLATRTARLRFRVDNADLALRPGQFGIAELREHRDQALTVPMDAVIDTGRSIYVFLARDEGRFEARTVVLGDQVGDRFVVLHGVAEGERVVSGATFLIDAESRLQASLAAGSPP